MALKVIKGLGWLKGVNASVAYTTQPKGTLARVSNMIYSSRGALRACDQNMGICTINFNGPVSNEGPFTAIQYFSPATNVRKILGLQKDVDTKIAAPTGLGSSVGGSGGTLPVNTYYYVVAALDGAGGLTTLSNEVTANVTSLGQNVTLNWTASPLAVGYNVYRGTAPGAESLLIGTGLPAPSNTFIDTGNNQVLAPFAITNIFSNQYGTNATFAVPSYTGGNLGFLFQVTGNALPAFNQIWQIYSSLGTGGFIAVPLGLPIPGISGLQPGGTGTYNIPPTTNTTQTVSLLDLSGLFYTKPQNVIKSFPADNVPIAPGFPPGGGRGGSGGGGSGGSGSGGAPQPGAVLGNTSPTPDLVPFAGKMIVVLGSGITPYQSDGTTAGTVPLTNSFTGAFPSWFATTSFSVGDIIQPATPNGHVYICIQGGISGSSSPTFPTGAGQTVTDAKVIWKEDGSNATVAPRGAAHAINHAGSLWLWNTQPSDTSDSLDGPSCLKMSDTNNPNSWNPINTAFVGRNDGQQGMGMAAFTIAEAGIPPTDTLVLFKEYSTYQVTGVFGASDFAIQQAQTDLGCIAPRTIKFVPGFGIVRLTHLGYAVFDGVRDRLISEEIRPYLFGGVSDISALDWSYAYFSKADQTAVPPMYVSAIPVLGNDNNGALTRLLCYDLVLKAWTIIDLPFGIGSLTQLRIPGGIPLTVFGGFNDGMMSRWQAGDQMGWQAWIDINGATHTGTLALIASFREGTIFGPDASDRLYFRRSLLRGMWAGGGTQGSSIISTSAMVDGKTVPTSPARYLGTPTGGPSDSGFEVVTDIGLTGLASFVTVTVTHAIGGSPVEIVGHDYHVVQRPVGGLVRVG